MCWGGWSHLQSDRYMCLWGKLKTERVSLMKKNGLNGSHITTPSTPISRLSSSHAKEGTSVRPKHIKVSYFVACPYSIQWVPPTLSPVLPPQNFFPWLVVFPIHLVLVYSETSHEICPWSPCLKHTPIHRTTRMVALDDGIWGNLGFFPQCKVWWSLWANFSARNWSEAWIRARSSLRLIPRAPVALAPPSETTLDVSVWGNYAGSANILSVLVVFTCTWSTRRSIFLASVTGGNWVLGVFSAVDLVIKPYYKAQNLFWLKSYNE